MSNHVYGTLVDKHGYLWLATVDGVYRYNGYSLKRYGYNEGLSNAEVWNFYEDKRGRIWLMSIAEDLGYIHHGKYTSVHRKSHKSDVLYPTSVTELGDSLIFSNRSAPPGVFELCIVVNDTLYSIIRPKNPNIYYYFVLQGKIVEGNDSAVGVFQTKDWINSLPPAKTIPLSGLKDALMRSTQRGSFFDKYIYGAALEDNKIFFFNIDSVSTDTIHLQHGLYHCFPGKKEFYALTKSRLFIYDTLLRQTSAIDLAQIPSPGNQNTMNIYGTADPLWNLCISTDMSGLFINLSGEAQYYKENTSLDGYRFSGYINDTVGAWWNDKKKQIAYVKNGVVINRQAISAGHHIKVVTFDNLKALLVSRFDAYWISPGKTPENLIEYYDSAYDITANKAILKPNTPLWNTRDAIVKDSLNFFLLKNVFGIDKATLHPKQRLIHNHTIHLGTYKGLAYNARHQLLVAYYDHKIFIQNLVSGSQVAVNSKQLALLGIRGIESIFCDDQNNIFIKDHSGIYCYNWGTHKLKKLFRNYRLEKSIVLVRDNVLYVAGSFGVIRSRIIGPGQLGDTRVYQNVKNLFYSYVTDVQFSPSSALLKTDKGLYNVDISTDGDIDLSNPFRIILSLNDTLCKLASSDTLRLSQDVNVMPTDIINPAGMGSLKMEYSINGSGYSNTGMQIVLPRLVPGSYNTVSLIASDDSWRSKPLKFTIYIQPKWWQTQTAKRIIFVLSLLAFIGFVYLVVVMTRRMVNRNNERRNQRRELELKSIYSQINPHFIFNSLSTAQYFVKKNRNKEAFDHINQFSDLLRAYIKSSRAKYISIAEEIENLENYLELQLTRFEEKFSYSIAVDPSVDPQTVKIPSLLLQPLVENALNHGIFHSETKGSLNISFKIDERDRDTLVCIVDDNGVGRQRSKELRSKIIRRADSYGTILIKELIDTFNKYEKINIEIEYVDKQQPASGTTVIVKIKNYGASQ